MRRQPVPGPGRRLRVAHWRPPTAPPRDLPGRRDPPPASCSRWRPTPTSMLTSRTGEPGEPRRPGRRGQPQRVAPQGPRGVSFWVEGNASFGHPGRHRAAGAASTSAPAGSASVSIGASAKNRARRRAAIPRATGPRSGPMESKRRSARRFRCSNLRQLSTWTPNTFVDAASSAPGKLDFDNVALRGLRSAHWAKIGSRRLADLRFYRCRL